MSDLLTLNAASYFDIELTSQILSLKRPIGGLVIAKGASHHLEVEGLAVGGMTFRWHRGEDRLGRHERFVIADAGAEPDDVRCPVFVNAGDKRDPSFMLGFHGRENGFGMIGDSIEIDEPHTDGIELTVDRATLRSLVWRWSRLDDRLSQRFGHDLGGKAVLPFSTEISSKMYPEGDEYTCQNIENRHYCNPT